MQGKMHDMQTQRAGRIPVHAVAVHSRRAEELSQIEQYIAAHGFRRLDPVQPEEPSPDVGARLSKRPCAHAKGISPKRS